MSTSNSPKTQNIQKGASLKDVDFKGGDNSTFNIGNTTQNNFLQQKPEFFEPNLELSKPPKFISPKPDLVNQLVHIVQTTGLLVLGGRNDIDKASLAKHVAWYLSENHPSEDNKKRSVKEWQRSSDPQSIDVELQQADRSGIFILTQITPQNVGYNLSLIQSAAIRQQHYVIASTDKPLESWKLSEEEKQSWKDLPSEDLYDSSALAQGLLDQLKDAGGVFQEVLSIELATADTSIAGNLTFRQVAEKLAMPEKIARFVQLLKKKLEDEKDLVEATVRQLIKQVTNNKSALNQWYYQILDSREQLLSLGLNFFDGLVDDQFFAALEAVVENVWQKRDPSLRALDYCDLDNLRNFFSINPIGTDTEVARIESRFSKQRLMLFEVAWKSHRRQILAALPIVTQLVANSVAERAFQQELYGDRSRCEQLRRVLSEAISDIGVISLNAVQDTLSQLAADEDEEVQSVAAYAMARWRDPEYDLDGQLFETLQNWQNNARLVSQIKSLLKEQSEEKSKEPQDYIRATIALTVSYAALYDPPNQLDKKLYKLLEKLSNDPNHLVRDRFRSTLSRVVRQHPEQLRDLLYQMMYHRDLIRAISSSLAFAYRNNPTIVLDTLERWQQTLSSVSSDKKPPRDNVLATIALTYGKIDCKNRNSPITPIQAFENIHRILRAETKPFIRQ